MSARKAAKGLPPVGNLRRIAVDLDVNADGSVTIGVETVAMTAVVIIVGVVGNVMIAVMIGAVIPGVMIVTIVVAVGGAVMMIVVVAVGSKPGMIVADAAGNATTVAMTDGMTGEGIAAKIVGTLHVMKVGTTGVKIGTMITVVGVVGNVMIAVMIGAVISGVMIATIVVAVGSKPGMIVADAAGNATTVAMTDGMTGEGIAAKIVGMIGAMNAVETAGTIGLSAVGNGTEMNSADAGADASMTAGAVKKNLVGWRFLSQSRLKALIPGHASTFVV